MIAHSSTTVIESQQISIVLLIINLVVLSIDACASIKNDFQKLIAGGKIIRKEIVVKLLSAGSFQKRINYQ